jgi:hypothetical protein
MQGVSLSTVSNVDFGEFFLFLSSFFFQMPECQTVPWYQNEKHANAGGNWSSIGIPQYWAEMLDARRSMPMLSYAFS